MNEYKAFWVNYVNFSDRTTVKGYWMAILFNVLATWVVAILGLIIKFPYLSSLWSLAVFLPGIAMVVRRLRDAGKNWPWIFISCVPCIGWIWMIVLLCSPSVADDGTATV